LKIIINAICQAPVIQISHWDFQRYVTERKSRSGEGRVEYYHILCLKGHRNRITVGHGSLKSAQLCT